MRLFHAPWYLLIAVASAGLAALQPVDVGALDAGSMAAITDQVLTSLTVDDGSGAPAKAE